MKKTKIRFVWLRSAQSLKALGRLVLVDVPVHLRQNSTVISEVSLKTLFYWTYWLLWGTYR